MELSARRESSTPSNGDPGSEMNVLIGISSDVCSFCTWLDPPKVAFALEGALVYDIPLIIYFCKLSVKLENCPILEE